MATQFTSSPQTSKNRDKIFETTVLKTRTGHKNGDPLEMGNKEISLTVVSVSGLGLLSTKCAGDLAGRKEFCSTGTDRIHRQETEHQLFFRK